LFLRLSVHRTEAAEGYTKTDEVIEVTIDENYVLPKRLKRLSWLEQRWA